MTSVQTTTNAASQALLNSVNGQKSTAATVDDTQNRFMTLLVTQMRNQDPLNPMDNAQVTSQMAQLSTVTGIDKLNTTMELLINNVQSGQSYQAANMIGHSVLVPGSTISTTDTGGYFGIELPLGADKLTVAINDASGNTIRTLNLGAQSAGVLPLNWDGLNSEGVAVRNGNYKFVATATANEKAVTSENLSYAEVMSISNNSSGVKLNLSNLTSVSTSDVKEIF